MFTLDKKKWFLRAEQRLVIEMDENPFFPFILTDSGVLQFSIRYTIFPFACVATFLSAIGLILCIVFDVINSSYFFIPIIALVVSIVTAYNYRATRYYTLYPEKCKYSFAHDDKVISEADYYNIYIRLKREVRSGTGANSKFFHLVLNGYKMDSFKISDSSKSHLDLRVLGQQIAENLNINYFDEANISPHHIVRHVRLDRNVLSFTKNMGVPMRESVFVYKTGAGDDAGVEVASVGGGSQYDLNGGGANGSQMDMQQVGR